MNPGMNSDARKDPDRLEREIDAQRREINETLRALEEKFSSREIGGQLMHYFGGHGREWAESLGSSLKANPIPAMLTAIGVTWLMMSDRNGPYRPSYSREEYYGRGYAHDGGYDRDYSRFDGAGASMRDAAQSVRDKAGELGDKAAHAAEALHEKAAHAGEGLHEKAAHAGEALHEKAAHARDALRSRASHARERFGHPGEHAHDNFGNMIRHQPLALGAVGIALGALLGAALPRTERETRAMGRASERIREKGKEMAREGFDKASQKAAEVADVAKKTLRGAETRRDPGNSAPGATPAQQTQQAASGQGSQDSNPLG